MEMVPQESQAEEQPVFDYLVANVGKKPGMPADNTVKGSQFNQPLLEFSGSCAGCAETSYAHCIFVFACFWFCISKFDVSRSSFYFVFT